ncbi:MAG TPA: PAS domain S-box protein [Solirubrobacteraceae bacterium]|nr:PAS domain S-box protein [Solirubrobacteraceae bacterium]
MEGSLEAQESNLRAVTESLNDAVISVDERSRIVFWNPAAARMFGYAEEEALGMELTAIMPSEYRARHLLGMARVVRGERGRLLGRTAGDLEGLRRDGTRFPMELSLGEWRAPGGRFFTGIVRDVTERRRTEERLERSNRDLEQVATIASHDLAAPAQSIELLAEHLTSRLGGELPAPALEMAHAIRRTAADMRALLTDLLAFARIGEEPRRSDVDLEKALAATLDALSAQISEAGAQVTHDALPTVRGSEPQLRQLLQNLIANAVKFAAARPPRVHLSATGAGDRWRVCVADNSAGIPPEQHEQVFDMFARGRNDSPGSGVGLAICRRIVEHHGGRIWIEGSSDAGTEVCFTLARERRGA